MTGPTTAQGTVSPAEVCSWSRLKENPHRLCMSIHSVPEGRLIIQRKGVQEKQGLDIWPVHRSPQALVARELRLVVLEVWVACHGSDSDQQLSRHNSV